jgi:hypothetical protein
MHENENERDETISKTVGDHPWEKILSPQRHDRQYDPYEQNHRFVGLYLIRT